MNVPYASSHLPPKMNRNSQLTRARSAEYFSQKQLRQEDAVSKMRFNYVDKRFI